MSKLVGCAYVGAWGLWLFDDNGAMQEKCMVTGPVGAKATYF